VILTTQVVLGALVYFVLLRLVGAIQPRELAFIGEVRRSVWQRLRRPTK